MAKASSAEIEILFTALKNEADAVRDAALRGLNALEDSVPFEPSHPLYMAFVERLWVAKCDPTPEHQLLADNLWDKHDLEPYEGLQEDVINDVVYPGSTSIRTAASLALSKCPDLNPGASLSRILELYDEKLETTPPVIGTLNSRTNFDFIFVNS